MKSAVESQRAHFESCSAGRIVYASLAARRNRHPHGFRLGGKSGFDAWLRRRGGARRHDVHREVRPAHDKFYRHESCGWCIPCREGTDWLKKTLTRFHAGGRLKKDIDNIYYLAENMLGKTFCPLGDAAAMPTMAFVKKFRKEFEDHLDGKPCAFEKAGVAEPVLA